MRNSRPSTHSTPNEGSIFDARVHFCHSRQRKADLRYKYGILFVANASSFALPLAPVTQISMTQGLLSHASSSHVIPHSIVIWGRGTGAGGIGGGEEGDDDGDDEDDNDANEVRHDD